MSEPNPLVAAKHYAMRDIDRAAGEARLRYITDVPGQQAVYMEKLQQAREYRAGVMAGVPAVAAKQPYIDAEAAATNRTAREVADAVLTAAAAWNDRKGPDIEAARVAGKRSVAAANGANEIEAARAAAVANLQTL